MTENEHLNKNSTNHDLSPADFQKYAHQAVDWIANFLETMREYPVLAKTHPGEIKQQLPEHPPMDSEDFASILTDFEEKIVPGITHWNHPRFFAYFSITGSAPGIIGEMLTAALNVNGMLWKSSPSATELEEVVLDWLRQMLDLPAAFKGVINDTASVSSLCAMAAAREAAGLNIREKGMAGRADLPPLRFYSSTEAHSSIEKAAITLGMGQEGLKKIPVDSEFQMDVTALEKAIQDDLQQGVKPIGVIATIGTTSTTSIDPPAAIAGICEKYQLWLHIDAAYGGAAALLPEKRLLFNGWERANSIVVNPHKWLFTPIDCSVLYCRQPDILWQAFSLIPEYLRTAEADRVTNFMDFGVALGRRFRALKLWMVFRAFGQQNMTAAIRDHIQFAAKLKEKIQKDPNFELLAPVPFSTLVFRFNPGVIKQLSAAEVDQLNETLLTQLNRTGQVFLSHTKLHGQFGIRLAIGNLKTTWEDIEFTWNLIQNEAKKLVNTL
ncbi:pyridoxal-dependent decarboxylase [candidate division KSB1 bacterium]|nr:pyridoxal-dependent decarboxylase [candidate division KSB1 bacterium]